MEFNIEQDVPLRITTVAGEEMMEYQLVIIEGNHVMLGSPYTIVKGDHEYNFDFNIGFHDGQKWILLHSSTDRYKIMVKYMKDWYPGLRDEEINAFMDIVEDMLRNWQWRWVVQGNGVLGVNESYSYGL
jgi:cobalamin biosynthesis Co2+ chelatase CbiK